MKYIRQLPEGSGMVCQDCMAAVDENMPRISGEEERNEPGTCFNVDLYIRGA